MNLEDNSVYVVPYSKKIDLLLDLSNEKELKNIKFYTIDEFRKLFTFSYDGKAISYLMEKYNYKYSVAKEVLDSVIFIKDKEYKSDKLNRLKNLKEELKDYLIYNNHFKNYISNKKIYVFGYDFIDNFDKEILDSLNAIYIENKNNSYNHEIIEFDSMFNEVIYVSNRIRDLLNGGIDINKIKLVNVSSDYDFLIKTIFKLENINVTIDNESIYSTNIVQKFFQLFDNDKDINLIKDSFDMNEDSNLYIYNKIVEVLNNYNFDIRKDIKREILINEFKQISNKTNNYLNEVEVKNINDIKDDEYAFLIGFNEGTIPQSVKDEDYLSDKEKEELNMSTSFEKGLSLKRTVINKIKSIKNLFISYSLSTPFKTNFKSSLIDELGYDVKRVDNNKYNYSNDLNRLLLSIKLDDLLKYSVKDEDLSVLYNNYKNIRYRKFDNSYKMIDKNKMYEYIDNSLKLSYSNISNYYKCKYKFYLENILKIDKYEDTFMTFIGSLFHYILSICFNDEFDFDKEYNNFIKDKEFTNKELFFINKLKGELLLIIDVIKKQYSHSKFDKSIYEKKFSVDISSNIKVTFDGIIDKMLLEEYKGNTLLVIVDYKTGYQDYDLKNTIYGFNLQLPIYLYLAKNSEIENVKVVGFYLQKIVNDEIKKDNKKSYELQKQDNLKLQGYSIYDEELLNEFDNTYFDSDVIKSLKKSKDGFYSYSKLLTNNQMDNLYKLVDNKIKEARDGILNAEFDINPKSIRFENVSCKFCKYKDICYRSEKDVINLQEVKDLDFLGGDENA